MTNAKIFLTIAGASFCALAANPAASQAQNCAQHEAVVKRLADRYNESRQVIGLAANGAVVVMFADPEAGGWSIVITRPGGPACLVASGEHFQHVAEELPVQGDGA